MTDYLEKEKLLEYLDKNINEYDDLMFQASEEENVYIEKLCEGKLTMLLDLKQYITGEKRCSYTDKVESAEIVNIDNHDCLRLYSVQGNLFDQLENMKSNLLRFGYLLKSNLPTDLRDSIYHVSYCLGEKIESTSETSTVLYMEKGKIISPYTLDDIIKIITDITGTKVVVYENTSVDLILKVTLTKQEEI